MSTLYLLEAVCLNVYFFIRLLRILAKRSANRWYYSSMKCVDCIVCCAEKNYWSMCRCCSMLNCMFRTPSMYVHIQCNFTQPMVVNLRSINVYLAHIYCTAQYLLLYFIPVTSHMFGNVIEGVVARQCTLYVQGTKQAVGKSTMWFFNGVWGGIWGWFVSLCFSSFSVWALELKGRSVRRM